MPKIPQVIAQAAPQGRAASAADFGAGQGLQRFAGAVSEVGDVTARLFDVEMTSRVSSALSQSAIEISNLESQEAQNPDHMGREDRFQKAAQKIRDTFSKSLRYPKYEAAFATDFDTRAAGSRLRLRAGTRKDTIDNARAVLDLDARDLAVEAGRYPQQFNGVSGEWEDPAKRQAAMGKYLTRVERLNQAGLVSDEESVRRMLDFKDDVLEQDIRSAIRNDPKAALDELEDTSGRFAGLDGVVRQRWIDTATSRWVADQKDEEREESADARQAALNLREAEKAAYLAGIELVRDKKWDALRKHIDEGQLSVSGLKYLEEHFSAGTGMESQSDRNVYMELARLAGVPERDLRERGKLGWNVIERDADDGGWGSLHMETVEDKIFEAYEDGSIDQSDFDKLMQLSKDRRFKFEEDVLRMRLTAVMNATSIASGFNSEEKVGKVTAASEDLQRFHDWKLANPYADREQAKHQVDLITSLNAENAIVWQAGYFGEPTHAVYKAGVADDDRGRKNIDLVATAAATSEALNSNDLTQEQHDQQIFLINSLEVLRDLAAGKSSLGDLDVTRQPQASAQ